jgi:hypothetical protein
MAVSGLHTLSFMILRAACCWRGAKCSAMSSMNEVLGE